MRSRNMWIVFTAVGLALLSFLASRATPTLSRPAQTAAATMAGTVESLCPTSAATAAPTGAAVATAAAASAEATAEGTEAAPSIARPSNPGGPGPALKLVGDVTKGEKVYVDNCQKCHGDQGQGNIANPGSDDGTIPGLNPIDDTIADADPVVFACNIDLFVEHGSVPSGPSPKETMQPWGDNKVLPPQDIADVIAYVMSINAKK